MISVLHLFYFGFYFYVATYLLLPLKIGLAIIKAFNQKDLERSLVVRLRNLEGLCDALWFLFENIGQCPS
jgi:hypothetical protein